MNPHSENRRWEQVAAEFLYLKPGADLCRDDHLIVDSFKKEWILRLSQKDLSLLERIYDQVMARDHGPRLVDEINSKPPHEMRGGPWACVFRLLLVFEALGDMGRPGFSNAGSTFSKRKQTPELRWTDLPEGLGYLREAAATFEFAAYVEPDRFVDQMSDEQVQLLASLAQEIRERDDWERVIQWCSAHEKSFPQESARLYGVLGLIDLLDV